MPGTGNVAVTTSDRPWVFTSAPASQKQRTFTSEMSRAFIAMGRVTSGPMPQT